MAVTAILFTIVGALLGSLWEKWRYYKRTGKHLQDVKSEKKGNLKECVWCERHADIELMHPWDGVYVCHLCND